VSALVVKNLSLSYTDQPVINNLSFELQPKQKVLLTGPSGIGKSSLLHVITGCIPAHIKANQQGEVLVYNQQLSTYSLSEKIQTINIVFQQPHWQFVTLTVMDELAFGLGSLNIEQHQMKQRIDEMLDCLDIKELKDKKLYECSLGQQQMIACASILLLKPRILCLDEALSAVDTQHKQKFMKVIFEQVETLLMVDHQPDINVVYTHHLNLENGVLCDV
jgi:energy-coupling factor transporter ATP-binding protein EcfA2